MNPLKKIQYNCRQATFLIEKKHVKKLSLREAIELRIHQAGCSACRLYDTQSRFIQQMMQKLFHDSVHSSASPLDDSFKQELQGRIEEELNKK